MTCVGGGRAGPRVLQPPNQPPTQSATSAIKVGEATKKKILVRAEWPAQHGKEGALESERRFGTTGEVLTHTQVQGKGQGLFKGVQLY